MAPRGRPRRFPDDHTRWRTHATRRRGQQPDESILADTYPFFLFCDPRAIPDVLSIDIPRETILDTVHEALDALSPPRETDIYPLTSPFEQTADLVGRDEPSPPFDPEQGDISEHPSIYRLSSLTAKNVSSSPGPDLSSPDLDSTGAAFLFEPFHQTPTISLNAGATSLPLIPLATSLINQLEQSHQCQQHFGAAPSPSTSDQASLSTLSGWTCPNVLSQPTIAQYRVDWNTLFPIEQRRKVFTGLSDSPFTPAGEPPAPTLPINLDLESDNVGDTKNFEVWLDVNSTGGLASSLAVAREGIA
ncbi:uncharacterized protein N7443_007109 [Penicillium atrosanguineum]|uniref:uncharacterized protein n=1 Tax=Penicillium atrosanguineum TaxID=1132637 RepID=UPI0023822FC0|nr:uncharacterized protein N7443_007109 [Penicillium atrosanguineum]KAJ5296216.1 hypothetical protein N7443_007109 [Penicillium atrosanguineum]